MKKTEEQINSLITAEEYPKWEKDIKTALKSVNK